MADTGYKTSGTITSTGANTYPGLDAWNSPSSASTVNSSPTQHAVSAAYPDPSYPFGPISETLQFRNFNMSVPAGATINGVEVLIHRTSIDGFGSGASVYDYTVQLVKAGTASGDNKADTIASWPVSTEGSETYTEKVYGGATDLWGLALTQTDANDTTFGVNVRIRDNGNSDFYLSVMNGAIDAVRIKIYYTTGGGGGTVTQNLTGLSASSGTSSLAKTLLKTPSSTSSSVSMTVVDKTLSKNISSSSLTNSIGNLLETIDKSVTGNNIQSDYGNITAETATFTNQDIIGNSSSIQTNNTQQNIDESLIGNNSSVQTNNTQQNLDKSVIGNSSSAQTNNIQQNIDKSVVGNISSTQTNNTQQNLDIITTGNSILFYYGDLSAQTASTVNQNLTGNNSSVQTNNTQQNLDKSVIGNSSSIQTNNTQQNLDKYVIGNNSSIQTNNTQQNLNKSIVGNNSSIQTNNVSNTNTNSVSLQGNSSSSNPGALAANTASNVTQNISSVSGTISTNSLNISQTKNLQSNLITSYINNIISDIIVNNIGNGITTTTKELIANVSVNPTGSNSILFCGILYDNLSKNILGVNGSVQGSNVTPDFQNPVILPSILSVLNTSNLDYNVNSFLLGNSTISTVNSLVASKEQYQNISGNNIEYISGVLSQTIDVVRNILGNNISSSVSRLIIQNSSKLVVDWALELVIDLVNEYGVLSTFKRVITTYNSLKPWIPVSQSEQEFSVKIYWSSPQGLKPNKANRDVKFDAIMTVQPNFTPVVGDIVFHNTKKHTVVDIDEIEKNGQVIYYRLGLKS